MNERIKELADKAIEDMPGAWNIPDEFCAKFAELIVVECVRAFEAEVDTWKQMDPYQGSMKRQGTKAIKQHFGVDE